MFSINISYYQRTPSFIWVAGPWLIKGKNTYASLGDLLY